MLGKTKSADDILKYLILFPQNRPWYCMHLETVAWNVKPCFHKKISIHRLLDLPRNSQYTRVLQKVLSLGSDYFSATFYQTYFYYKPSKYPPLLKHIFVTFLSSREKQINRLHLVFVGDTDKLMRRGVIMLKVDSWPSFAWSFLIVKLFHFLQYRILVESVSDYMTRCTRHLNDWPTWIKENCVQHLFRTYGSLGNTLAF